MTIAEAQKRVDQWIKSYGVRYFNELTNMAVLTEEVIIRIGERIVIVTARLSLAALLRFLAGGLGLLVKGQLQRNILAAAVDGCP